jgi:hypothetical protein
VKNAARIYPLRLLVRSSVRLNAHTAQIAQTTWTKFAPIAAENWSTGQRDQLGYWRKIQHQRSENLRDDFTHPDYRRQR